MLSHIYRRRRTENTHHVVKGLGALFVHAPDELVEVYRVAHVSAHEKEADDNQKEGMVADVDQAVGQGGKARVVEGGGCVEQRVGPRIDTGLLTRQKSQSFMALRLPEMYECTNVRVYERKREREREVG